MAWSEERVETLKRLWRAGYSASQIAGKLGGVTRNAVIGKVYRLGLSARKPVHTGREINSNGFSSGNWTKEKVRELIKAVNDGLDPVQITIKVERNIYSVKAKLRQLRIMKMI